MAFPIALAAMMGIFSQIMTNIANAAQTREQRQYNTDMWNASNEFNSPMNQVQRLKDAGINPNTLSLSNGSTVSGGAASPPPSVSPIPMIDPMQSSSGSLLNMYQAFHSGEEAETIRSKRQLELENARLENQKLLKTCEGLDITNANQAIVLQYANAYEFYKTEGVKADVRLKAYQAKEVHWLTNKTIAEIEKVIPAEVAKTMADTNESVLNLQVLTAKIADYYASVGLKEAETEESQSRKSLIDAETVTEAQRTNAVAAETYKTASEGALNEENLKTFGQIQNLIIEQYGVLIDQIVAQTDLTKEEAYWYLFKLMSSDRTSIKIGPLSIDSNTRNYYGNFSGGSIGKEYRSYKNGSRSR